MSGNSLIEVTVLFLQGGHVSTAIAPMEVFRSAGVIWNVLEGNTATALFRVRTATTDGRPVACDGPVRVVPECGLRDIPRTDLVWVPATGLAFDELLSRHGDVVPWLKRKHRQGAAIASTCTGAALLAEAGLLDGKAATTHWGVVEEYRRRYPAVDWHPELFIAEADDIYTGGGVYASLDLSLYLVEKYAGHEVAVQCGKSLLIDTPRTWQSGFAAPPSRPAHADEAILAVEGQLREGFHRSLSLDEVAHRAGMSRRNFARRFKQATGDAPLTYLHKLRVEQAKHLLEAGPRTVQEVAIAVGYEDVPHFRRLFRRYAGITPSAYRQRFGRP
jgi:transcriptional regulator GlxA family with amidase domain